MQEFLCYVIPKIKNDLLTSFNSCMRNICSTCYKQLKTAFVNFQTMLTIL